MHLKTVKRKRCTNLELLTETNIQVSPVVHTFNI